MEESSQLICLIDDSKHLSLLDLHKYLRRLGVNQQDYYLKYHARKDRFSGELLPFVKGNVEKYLSSEFLNKDTLRKWIAANPTKGREWAIRWLANRRSDKSLTFPPTQVELHSLLCPTKHYYDRVGGYNEICKSLGYQINLDGVMLPSLLPAGSHIIIDTRESRPLDIVGKTVRAKVNAGDYALDTAHDQGIYVERKSLSDFVGTLSDRRTRGDDSNRDRFSRELTRAKEVGAYIVMLVEEPIETALHFDTASSLSHVKVSPEHIFKNLRDFLHEFDNFQALFVNGRSEAARAVVRILGAGEVVKKVDLQHVYERGELI